MDTSLLINILLVEDEPADIYLIRRAIADWSHQVFAWVVSTSSDALAFLRKEPPFAHVPTPELILLDLSLPGRDGRAILAELRRMSAYQATPVVVVSASKKAIEEPRCRQLGANDYVQKSTDFSTYFGGIQTILRDWLSCVS